MKMSFGKYRGHDIKVVKADTRYVDWLTGQPWFEIRYPAMCAAITGQSVSVGDACYHPPRQTTQKLLPQANIVEQRGNCTVIRPAAWRT